MKKITNHSMSVRSPAGTALRCYVLHVRRDCIWCAQKARSEDYQKKTTEGNGFNACDTYALAAAINDTLVTEMEEVRS